MALVTRARETPDDPYEIDVEQLAGMFAAHASGFWDAIPVQEDYDLARRVVEIVENHYRDNHHKSL